MKRRTLVLGLGGLATLSASATATVATFAESISIGADFRAVEYSATVEPKLELRPANQETNSTHEWELDGLVLDEELEEIYLEYPEGTDADAVIEDDVTVEIVRPGDSEPSEVDVHNQTEGDGSTIDIRLQDQPIVDGYASIEVDNIVNPTEGEYTPSITLVLANGNEPTTEAEMSVAGDVPFFDVEITDVPERIGEDEEITITYDLENSGDETGEQDVVVTGNDDEKDVRTFELAPGETATETVTFDSDDATGSTLIVEVASDDISDSQDILRADEWELTVDEEEEEEEDDDDDGGPPGQGGGGGGDTIHIYTWENSFVGFDGEVSTITQEYQDAEVDEVDDVTVEMELEGDDDLTEVPVESIDATEHTLSITLGSDPIPELEGETVITVEDVDPPNQLGNENHEHETTISLDGPDDSATHTTTYF